VRVREREDAGEVDGERKREREKEGEGERGKRSLPKLFYKERERWRMRRHNKEFIKLPLIKCDNKMMETFTFRFAFSAFDG
jgi:hypothetical protein